MTPTFWTDRERQTGLWRPSVNGAPALLLLHTWQLYPATLAGIRSFLEASYDDFSAEDWAHTVGGLHAMAWSDGKLVGHGSVVQRQMIHSAGGQSRVVRVGYIEGVAVRADWRRRGVGGTIMSALEDVIRGGYDFGGLSASDEGMRLYETHGWQRWQGRTFALTPDGVQRTEEEDEGIFVLPVGPVDLTGDLTCDWRDGDVW